MNIQKYHTKDLSKFNFLITGGAGFIGSNIAEYLLINNANLVRVVDNFSNSTYSNLATFSKYNNFEFIEGDITDYNHCEMFLNDIDFVSHQAALGSVPRSIKEPLSTNNANVSGFLNMLTASKDSKTVKKFVYASSSAVYGNSDNLIKQEGIEGIPLSPYAITKSINEMYARNFSQLFNFHTIGLRYFNVFGPRQNTSSQYSAVIPIFCNNFLNSESPIIYGDGNTNRDFTYIENVVQANILALLDEKLNEHNVFNVACGEKFSLNNIIELLNNYTGKSLMPNFKDFRKGDIKSSLADISKVSNNFGYHPHIKFPNGLIKTYEWYKSKIINF